MSFKDVVHGVSRGQNHAARPGLPREKIIEDDAIGARRRAAGSMHLCECRAKLVRDSDILCEERAKARLFCRAEIDLANESLWIVKEQRAIHFIEYGPDFGRNCWLGRRSNRRDNRR